jgi:DNA-binding transcriptional MerR regulator
MFTQTDIRNLRIIHQLLKEEGMTLSGARKKISEKWDETSYKFEINESLQKIKSILLDIKENI